jgi:hypothetical protein
VVATVFTGGGAGTAGAAGIAGSCLLAAAAFPAACIFGVCRRNAAAIPADRMAIHAVVANSTFIRSYSVYDGEAAERNNAFGKNLKNDSDSGWMVNFGIALS